LSRDVEFLESESRFTIEALEAKLSASISSAKDKTVATMTSQRDDLLAELQRKDSQWEKDLEIARTAEQKTREELEDVLHRMSEVATHLQDVESERDSLRLQITNLMTDMQDVQEELNNAEGRYTTLQFHQLSNMTNNEATRNLRGQIEELENRVMRRTEQIGIHQHDIKRLETNLRLQEERLTEMTTELEMMAAQKDAMVEDCADARETRDEALIRVEQLEEELESSDGRNADNAVVVESLIATIAQTVCQAREAIRLSKEEVAEARSTHAQQSTTIQQLQEKEIALRKSIQEYQNDSLQDQIEEQGRLLETNLRLQEERLAEMTTELEMMAAQKNAMVEDCADARETRDEALIRVERLEEELESLDGRNADNAVVVESLIATIAQTVCQAREAIRLSKEEVAETRSTHAQQSTTIQQLQEKEIALRKSIQEYQNDSLQGQIEEQGRLLETNLRLQEERLAEMTTELEMMAAQKNAMAEDCADARETRDEALIRVERLEEELESSDGRDADNAVIMESLIATIAQTVCQAREAIRLSREEVAEARSTHAQQSTTIQQLQEKEIALRKSVQEYQNDSLQDQIEEQGRLLDICKREVTQIRDRLQEEEEGRAQDKKQHAMVLLSEKERNEDADTTISQLRGELKTLERNLQQINEHLQSVEDEKLTLRQQMTELEAEVQRSKSLSHYLEIQIKDR
jgi:chromosome segregation ATPase